MYFIAFRNLAQGEKFAIPKGVCIITDEMLTTNPVKLIMDAAPTNVTIHDDFRFAPH
jgi:hypothetical protein